VVRKEYKINNVSVMVEAGEPRLENKRDMMQESLSKLLRLKKDQVGMAFTSGEKLTSFGRGEGIQAWVVVVLTK